MIAQGKRLIEWIAAFLMQLGYLDEPGEPASGHAIHPDLVMMDRWSMVAVVWLLWVSVVAWTQ